MHETDELDEGAKALVEQYKESAEEAEVDVANNFSCSTATSFAGAESLSNAEIIGINDNYQRFLLIGCKKNKSMQFSLEIQEFNAATVAKHNAESSVAVEGFAGHAYTEGLKVNGFKLILNNFRARAAFIKFLNADKDGGNFEFFQEMERLRNASPNELAEGKKALVEQYNHPADTLPVASVTSTLTDTSATNTPPATAATSYFQISNYSSHQYPSSYLSYQYPSSYYRY